jgi:hypothetical protein
MAEQQFCASWTASLLAACFPSVEPTAQLNAQLGWKRAAPAAANGEPNVEPTAQLNAQLGWKRAAPAAANGEPNEKKGKNGLDILAATAFLSATPPPDTDDLFEHLSDSLQVASKLINEPVIVFDDMADVMDRCIRPAIFMELFSESFQLCIARSHSENQKMATLRCSRCRDDGPSLSLGFLLSPEPLPTTVEYTLRDFVVRHASTCPMRCARSRSLFTKQANIVSDEFWRTFARWWQVYLGSLLRSCETASDDEQEGTVKSFLWDIYRPWTCKDDFDRVCRAVLSQLPPPLQATHVPVIDVPHKTIIVDNELYRDSEANRWYRNEISNRRRVYARSTSVERKHIVKSLVKFVEDSGYEFKSIGDDEKVYPTPRQRVCEVATTRLVDGFPDLVASVLVSGSKQRLVEVEFAPKIGLAHGGIRLGKE